MSLSQPPVSPEKVQALPPDIQALIAKTIDHYEQRIADYEQRIAELEAELAGLKKSPRNSSVPPSTEHPHAKPPRDKKKSKKKRGGQPGHPKHERPLIPPRTVQRGRSAASGKLPTVRRASGGRRSRAIASSGLGASRD